MSRFILITHKDGDETIGYDLMVEEGAGALTEQEATIIAIHTVAQALENIGAQIACVDSAICDLAHAVREEK